MPGTAAHPCPLADLCWLAKHWLRRGQRPGAHITPSPGDLRQNRAVAFSHVKCEHLAGPGSPHRKATMTRKAKNTEGLFIYLTGPALSHPQALG